MATALKPTEGGEVERRRQIGQPKRPGPRGHCLPPMLLQRFRRTTRGRGEGDTGASGVQCVWPRALAEDRTVEINMRLSSIVIDRAAELRRTLHGDTTAACSSAVELGVCLSVISAPRLLLTCHVTVGMDCGESGRSFMILSSCGRAHQRRVFLISGFRGASIRFCTNSRKTRRRRIALNAFF